MGRAAGRCTSLMCALLAAAPAFAGGGGVDAKPEPARIGTAAPTFSWDQVIQGPANQKLSLASLHGRVVVVDFWSTGCGPCLTAIPWWNKLVDRFADKPVTFIAVSEDKDAKTVRRLLAKLPMRGWITLDADRSMFRAYAINGTPSTVVIDKNGHVVGWPSVDYLADQPNVLEQVLRGEAVKLPEHSVPGGYDPLGDEYASLGGAPGSTDRPLCLLMIRPASGRHGLVGGTRGQRRLDEVSLKGILREFYPIRGGALVFEFEPPEDKYDVMFSWPVKDLDRGHALMRQAIEATFGITVSVEKRLTDVYVMTVDNSRVADWMPAHLSLLRDPETGMTAPNEEILRRMKAGEKFLCGMGPISVLVDGYSGALGAPVVDESGVDGIFTYCYPWDRKTATEAETIAAAKKYLGVMLTPAKREIEVHVVRRRTHDSNAHAGD